MKKALLLVMFLPLFAQGQVSKGSKFLGGNLSFTSTKYNESNQPATDYLDIELYNGKFVSNSLAIGPIVSLESRWASYINPVTNLYEKSNSNSYLGGMFVRKYFEISDKFYFAMEGSLAAGVGKSAMGDDEFSVFNYQIAAKPMFIFQPVPKWAFLARVGEISVQNRSQVVDLTRVQFDFGLVNFGVNYFLKQK